MIAFTMPYVYRSSNGNHASVKAYHYNAVSSIQVNIYKKSSAKRFGLYHYLFRSNITLKLSDNIDCPGIQRHQLAHICCVR